MEMSQTHCYATGSYVTMETPDMSQYIYSSINMIALRNNWEINTDIMNLSRTHTYNLVHYFPKRH
jgi:hypothetical protein